MSNEQRFNIGDLAYLKSDGEPMTIGPTVHPKEGFVWCQYRKPDGVQQEAFPDVMLNTKAEHDAAWPDDSAPHAKPSFNHTRSDGPYDPCGICLQMMTRDRLIALASYLQGVVGDLRRRLDGES